MYLNNKHGGFNEKLEENFKSISMGSMGADVGDLNNIVFGSSGQSSFTHGYRSGGISSHPTVSPPYPTIIFVNQIDRFPFSVDANATDVADMLASNKTLGGFSSNVSGFNAGGNLSPDSISATNIIQKFPFASAPATSTDVADITVARFYTTGTQD